MHTFVCVIKLFLGSEDLVKTNSHPGDPYSLIVEVSSKLRYNWQFCFRYFLIYYLIHLIFSLNWKTKDVSTDDSGFYTCTAGNILGETASFKLFMKDFVEFCVILMMHSSQLWTLHFVAKVTLLTVKTNLTTLLIRRAEPTLRSRGLQKNWSKVKCFSSSPCSLWYLDMLSKLPPCDMLCMVCVIWAIEHACICSNFWRTARFIQWHRVWLKCHTYHVNEMKCSKRCRCNIFFVCF